MSADPETTAPKMDLTNEAVVGKYKEAADIAQRALKLAISLCVADAKIAEITAATDAFIVAETGNSFKKDKKMLKGIGFPTCVSVNNVVGHFSPFAENTAKLAVGDVAKIDLGVHLDGFLATVAHTVVVGGAATGAKADVIVAAAKAAAVAARMVVNGAANTAVTEAIAAIAADYKVTPVLGVISHSLERNTIDGEKTIMNKEDNEHKGKECVFATGEAYAVDVILTTGEGKPRAGEERTTVYRRVAGVTYSLKVKASRALLGEVDTKFPSFPFSLTACDSKTARLGIVECESHALFQPFPVMQEKKGSIVAQFKHTVLLMPNGTTHVITGLPVDETQVKSELAVTNEEYLKTLEIPAIPKPVKAKKAEA